MVWIADASPTGYHGPLPAALDRPARSHLLPLPRRVRQQI
jgi:hypothetical protein